MTTPTTQHTAPASDLTGGRRRTTLVASLAISQTIGYGTLYYAFAVLLAPMAAHLHTSTTAVTGAYTASVLTGAALAVPVGRWLDRHGGRILMTAGSTAGALLMLAWSQVDALWQLYLVQIGIGAASAASLYEAAFAVVIAATSAERRSNALLALTVVAGFASTIFLPLTGWLVADHGWRTAVLVLAGIQGLTVPLHVFAVRQPTDRHNIRAARDPDPRPGAGVVPAALADRGFWLLALGFTVHTAAITAVTVHLVAALISWGHPPAFAATIAGLLGALSVAGRLLPPDCNAAIAPRPSPPQCSASKPPPHCSFRSSARTPAARSAPSSASASASASPPSPNPSCSPNATTPAATPPSPASSSYP